MDRYSNPLGTLTLLPCTMENRVFVTNLKWKICCLDFNRRNQYWYSEKIFVHDPIKNEPIKIRLRLTHNQKGHTMAGIYQVENKQDNHWKLCSSVDLQHNRGYFEFTVRFLNNIYYSRKNLKTDLRQYLTTIHGETFDFNGETYSIYDCFNGVMLAAFIEQEYNENFIIECQEKEFKIKKIIIQARSPVFDAMLSSNYFNEGRENRMVIKDCGSEVVEKMVEFFQTDFVKNTTDFEVELYETARKYISESFMEFTRLPFVNSITIRNYDKRLRIAEKHNDSKTKKLMKEWYNQNQRRR